MMRATLKRRVRRLEAQAWRMWINDPLDIWPPVAIRSLFEAGSAAFEQLSNTQVDLLVDVLNSEVACPDKREACR
jgi:hypothetical protein